VRSASILVALAVVALGREAGAQTIPEGSQAAKVQQAYRRTPSFRHDPFRHVSIPHWGVVFSLGATGTNNALNAEDLGAILFLADSTKNPGGLLVSDAIDIVGLVPQGQGFRGSLSGEGGAYLGGPFGRHLSIGFSGQGRAYGSGFLDDTFVALARDGNGATQQFSLGRSGGAVLATAEAGAHAIIRLGPLGSPDGVQLALGFGGRMVKPLFFGRASSLLANGGTITVTGTTVAADVQVQVAQTRIDTLEIDPTTADTSRPFSFSRFRKFKGDGIAGDFLVRLEWPTSGLALEAVVANLGNVTVNDVETKTWRLNVATTSLGTVKDSLNSSDSLAVKDTVNLEVTLPRIVRFTASAWANRILQIDLSTTMRVTGDFETPLAVDIGTTWRFIRTLPLRVGMSIGGVEGIGFSGGLAIEGRNMFFQLGGQSLGGFMRNAKGAGARLELGLFF
jgi:hypothetical protein